MLDFNHILSNPNIDIQTFIGQAQSTAGAATGEWKTWRKPRGAKFVYMIGVGGGGSGGCGINTSTTSGGGSGGCSGAQTTLMIPAMFLPDVLYIQAGLGGVQPATLVSGAVSVTGTITYVSLEPWNTLVAQLTVLFASGGPTGTAAAAATTGGTATSVAPNAAITNMPLAGRGAYNFFAGQAAAAGGTNTTAGVAPGYASTGIMVMGGAGGGGSPTNGSGSAGGAISSVAVGFGDNFPTIAGGTAGSTSAGGAGSGGLMLKPFQYTGGTGGGGAAGGNGGNTGVAGAGGNGAPGCGGGGAGGSNNTVTTLGRPGDGGPGFVYIYSW